MKIKRYQEKADGSQMMKELYDTRNFKGGFKKGLVGGLAHGFVTNFFTKGAEFWNIRNKKPDTAKTELASQHTPIEYPKADGVFTFDLLENLARTGTHHDHDQPSHLRIK